MQLLTFTLTGMDYGISLENVESIESKMNVVVVPTSPANIRGIIRLHGEILPALPPSQVQRHLQSYSSQCIRWRGAPAGDPETGNAAPGAFSVKVPQ